MNSKKLKTVGTHQISEKLANKELVSELLLLVMKRLNELPEDQQLSTQVMLSDELNPFMIDDDFEGYDNPFEDQK